MSLIQRSEWMTMRINCNTKQRFVISTKQKISQNKKLWLNPSNLFRYTWLCHLHTFWPLVSSCLPVVNIVSFCHVLHCIRAFMLFFHYFSHLPFLPNKRQNHKTSATTILFHHPYAPKSPSKHWWKNETHLWIQNNEFKLKQKVVPP